MRLAGDVESNPGPYGIINQFKAILIRVITAQKMKFSIKDFFSKCDQIRNLNEKLHFLCSGCCTVWWNCCAFKAFFFYC